MSSDLLRTALVPPPRPAPDVTVNVSDFMALKTIVQALVSVTASEIEKENGKKAQQVVNDLAEVCINALARADLSVSDGRSVEPYRKRAMEEVNKILGGVIFPQLDGRN